MEESEASQAVGLAQAEHQAAVAAVGHVEPNEGRNQGVGSVGLFAKMLKYGLNSRK